MDAEALREYDVVITTYQTVVGEHSGASSGKSEVPSKKKQRVQQSLFEVKWKVRLNGDIMHHLSQSLSIANYSGRSP